MPDKVLDSPEEAFVKDKDPSPNECEMAGKVSAFACGELGARESEKIREHMHTCRYCLDMYMDLRMADQQAAEENGTPGEGLPGLEKTRFRGKLRMMRKVESNAAKTKILVKQAESKQKYLRSRRIKLTPASGRRKKLNPTWQTLRSGRKQLESERTKLK